MVALTPRTNEDPTLSEMNRMIDAGQHSEKRRGYLGMSAIGNECSRQLWYGFRWTVRVTFDAATLKRFDDGHRSEDIMAERLRAVGGVTLITTQPGTGEQIALSDFGGHFRGHMDGIIVGIYQAPKTPHVWEHKATNEGKQEKLDKLKSDLGEKRALAKWDEVYHAQAQVYMHYSEHSRHYLTCGSPGTRTETSVRTDYDAEIAQRLRDKAERIIFAEEAPAPISADRTNFKCKWCDFRDVCVGAAQPDRNCRTCAHSTPERDGGWSCARGNPQASEYQQGCCEQRYHPDLVPGEAIDANEKENWILYRLPDGSEWKDEGQ